MITLKLADVIETDHTAIVIGRPKGEYVRARLELDKHDREPNVPIEIEVPNHLIALNSGFLATLIGPSILTLGQDDFNAKYRFIGKATIQQDIKDTVERFNRVRQESLKA